MLTPEQIKRLRLALGWTVTKAASKFLVGVPTWSGWEKRKVRKHAIHEQRLLALYTYQFGEPPPEVKEEPVKEPKPDCTFNQWIDGGKKCQP